MPKRRVAGALPPALVPPDMRFSRNRRSLLFSLSGIHKASAKHVRESPSFEERVNAGVFGKAVMSLTTTSEVPQHSVTQVEKELRVRDLRISEFEVLNPAAEVPVDPGNQLCNGQMHIAFAGHPL